ncbi:hypothetical protein [Roseovarius confluentis]|uniref:hypothetical protein n=1 Tax=Roseovarius confluentis TaxID=1852027 RepID=UPI003C7E896D
MLNLDQMTGEQRVRHTLAAADFLSTRRGLVCTADLARYLPPSNAPVTLAKEEQ